MEIRRCMKCMHALAAGETVCPECGRPTCRFDAAALCGQTLNFCGVSPLK